MGLDKKTGILIMHVSPSVQRFHQIVQRARRFDKKTIPFIPWPCLGEKIHEPSIIRRLTPQLFMHWCGHIASLVKETKALSTQLSGIRMKFGSIAFLELTDSLFLGLVSSVLIRNPPTEAMISPKTFQFGKMSLSNFQRIP